MVLWEEYKAGGVRILSGSTNRSWALEMTVQDTDGHVLDFGSELLENEHVCLLRHIAGLAASAVRGLRMSGC
jgi:hypothetical protein